MLISLLTPTADRPDAIELCARWIGRMDVPKGIEVEWLVATDNRAIFNSLDEDTATSPDQVLWTSEESFKCPTSLQRNTLNLLDHARGEWLCIIEDDDWYRGDYLVRIINQIEPGKTAIVSNGGRQYNVKFRRWRMVPRGWTWARTLFHQRWVVDVMEKCLEGGVYLDKSMRPVWSQSAKVMHNIDPVSGLPSHVSITGLPGTPGIVGFHRQDKAGHSDPSMVQLLNWVGPEGRTYERFYEAG